jgi:hypothetical protein
MKNIAALPVIFIESPFVKVLETESLPVRLQFIIRYPFSIGCFLESNPARSQHFRSCFHGFGHKKAGTDIV